MHEIDEAAAAHAARQRGRFTRGQVRQGIPNAHGAIHTRLRAGSWLRLTSRVLALPGAPFDPTDHLVTASLHFGGAAVVSHGSAALVHGLVAVEACPPTVTVPNGSHRRSSDFVVHQSRDLVADDIAVVGGLQVTTLARTIVDLAPAASDSRVDAWLDHVTAERLLHPAEVAGVLDRVAHQGKGGLQALVGLVGERLAAQGVEMGALERRLTSVLRSAGLGRGEAQYPHPARSEGGAYVDRAFPAARLLVEVDGRTWHDRKLQAAADARRDRAAAVEGWLTVRYRHDDLSRWTESVAEELREIHGRRLLDLRRVEGADEY